MLKSVFINVDDDVGKIIKKIRNESAPNLVLVVPKKALLFSPFVDLKNLRTRIDELHKKVYVFTMDLTGQQRLLQAGFKLRNPDPHHPRLGMEFRKPAHRPRAGGEPPLSGEVRREHAEHLQTHVPKPESVGPVVIRHDAPAAVYQPPPAQARVRRHPAMLLFKTVLIAGILVLFALITVILPEARVAVYARAQPITRDIQIVVDKSAESADVQQLLLPGQVLDSDEQYSKKFEATGQVNVGNKAQGAVQIYNFSSRTYKLNADTTTLTVGTKSYRLQNDVSGIKPTAFFPGTQDVNPGTLTPEVAVIADAPGEESNLPAGTRLEIHNRVLGSVPQILYAKSTKSIENGTSRFRTVISQVDIDNAKKNLEGDLLISIRQQLSNSKSLTILDSGSNLQVKNLSFDHNAGDEALNFTGTASGHITALAFDQGALKKLVEQQIGTTLDVNKYLITDQREKILEDFKSIDLNAGKGVLNIHFESLVAARIDTQGIAGKINGKTPAEVREILLSDPEIERVDIDLKPFWIKSVPKFSGKVYVTSKLSTPR